MTRVIVRSAVAVAARPWLWTTALRSAARLAPERWWARAPFLPVPSSTYLAFRLQTQYGGTGAPNRSPVEVRDVLNYLAWCREWENHRAVC